MATQPESAAAEVDFFITAQLQRLYRNFRHRLGDRIAGVGTATEAEGKILQLDFYVQGRSPRRVKLCYSTSGGLDYLVASTEVGQAVTLGMIETSMRLMGWLDCPGYSLSLQRNARLVLSQARRPLTVIDNREFYDLTLGLVEMAARLEANLARLLELPPEFIPDFRQSPFADAAKL